MVEPGRTAVIHYTARMVDGPDAGEIVDTTDVDIALESGVYDGHRDYQPLSFEVGGDEVLPGLDAAVRDMENGEERTVVLEPEDAFGNWIEDEVHTIPRAELEERSDTEAEEGELVRSDTGATGWITAVEEETVTVDFNHELAGERLEFDIRVIDVQ
ncbi:MAG: peptidylprolyl isomerase [Halodesulfurarchaeum sp.]